MTSFAKSTAAILALSLAIPMVANAKMGATATVAKKTMSYDCMKAGNKNKASCKTAATTTTTKKSMIGGMMGKKTAASTTTKMTTTKAGTVAYTTKSGKVIHYDCTKAGNKNKAACKGH